MGQLGRSLLSPPSGSPDEDSATPDECGSYGELMDEIDRVLEDVSRDEPDRPIG